MENENIWRMMIEQDVRELGTENVVVFQNIVDNRSRIQMMLQNDEGKFRVLGIDQFSDEDDVDGEFDNADEALDFAEAKTKDAMSSASHEDIATVYYAYTPEGVFLGNRDPWKDRRK